MNDLNLIRRYEPISVAMHWITLLLMIAIYASISLHEAIPRGNPWRGAMEDWHIYFGFTVLALALIRLAVNLRLRTPPISPPPPVWQLRVSAAVKIYLYVLMLVTPVFGWLLVSGEGESVNWFFIPMPALAAPSESLADLAGEVHEMLGESGYFFIALHAVAALYHHYMVKDDTLRRMLPAFLQKQGRN
jgi:cytochrome b561